MNKKSVLILGIELLILVILFVICNTDIVSYFPHCWIYEKTGLLCPACGGTRLFVNLFRGNIKDAFFSNMMFFIILIYLFIFNIIYIINLNRKDKIATWIYPKVCYVLIAVVLIIVYTIIRNLL